MKDDKKNGSLVEPTTMRFERLLPGPIDRVWDYLTRPELLTTWLGIAASIDVREGGKLELTMDHGEKGRLPDDVKAKLVDADKITPKVHGTVTRVVQGRALAYTWEDTMSDPDAPLSGRSEVTFELEPRGEDVLLVLTHRRIIPKFAPQALGGWHTLLDLLEARTRGEPVFNFFDRFEENLKRYASLSSS
ncbi:MAG: SRPBCC family protein [Polyangiales bacterium]